MKLKEWWRSLDSTETRLLIFIKLGIWPARWGKLPFGANPEPCGLGSNLSIPKRFE